MLLTLKQSQIYFLLIIKLGNHLYLELLILALMLALMNKLTFFKCSYYFALHLRSPCRHGESKIQTKTIRF